MTIYCGRDFSPADIQTIRALIEHNPKLLRSPLSRRLCELFAWFKPNGELKDMTWPRATASSAGTQRSG